MSHCRSLSWSAAIRDLHADRITFAPGERTAHCREQVFTKLACDRAQALAHTRPLAAPGTYDRSAIVSSANAAAKARREVTGERWSLCLSAALRGTWQAAKAACRLAKSRGELNAQRALALRNRLEVHQLSAAKGEVSPRPKPPPPHS